MNLFKPRHQEPDAEEESRVEGEREPGSVNKSTSLQNKITNWAFFVGVCAIALVFLFKYYSNMYEHHQKGEEQTRDATHTAATTTLPPLALPEPEPGPTIPVSGSSASDFVPPLQQPAHAAAMSGGPQPAKTQMQLWRERRLKSGVRFSLDGRGSSVGTADTEPSVAAASSMTAAAIQAEAASGAAGARVHSATPFAPMRAYRVPAPTLMITRGKVIPCTVIPAIDTTLTGIVTCVTAEDATGTDNRVTLMERGTRCTGRQGGGVTNGQRRVGIIWQRCETPQHVLVPLDAGAADALGRPGIAGQVDDHFWDRFGAAIALSLVTEIGPYLAATHQGGSNNTTIAFPIVSGPQELMSEVLKHTVDIAPTITAPQGARVLIYLADDIDFRDVYQLERKH